MTRCPKCGTEYSFPRVFCGQCGARIGERCGYCGAACLSDDTFCGLCGRKAQAEDVSQAEENEESMSSVFFGELMAEAEVDKARAGGQDGALAQEDISEMFRRGQED